MKFYFTLHFSVGILSFCKIKSALCLVVCWGAGVGKGTLSLYSDGTRKIPLVHWVYKVVSPNDISLKYSSNMQTWHHCAFIHLLCRYLQLKRELSGTMEVGNKWMAAWKI
jgi:hypothetical protein